MMLTRAVVAWCAGDEMYVDESEIGHKCSEWMNDECTRTLRKRVGYIDVQCEEHPIFFARKDYEAHVREDH